MKDLRAIVTEIKAGARAYRSARNTLKAWGNVIPESAGNTINLVEQVAQRLEAAERAMMIVLKVCTVMDRAIDEDDQGILFMSAGELGESDVMRAIEDHIMDVMNSTSGGQLGRALDDLMADVEADLGPEQPRAMTHTDGDFDEKGEPLTKKKTKPKKKAE